MEDRWALEDREGKIWCNMFKNKKRKPQSLTEQLGFNFSSRMTLE